MRHLQFLVTIPFIGLVLTCSDKNKPSDLEGIDETGCVQIAVNLGAVGKLSKTERAVAINMDRLTVSLTAENQDTVFDSLILTGGSQERTERKTYSGLVAMVNGISVKWTLFVQALDKNGRIIHSGDTTFILVLGDTVDIPVFLEAQYSMLVANYFPVRDYVTRCELSIDGYVQADSSFPAQTRVGDTVTLLYDYLIASSGGISHHLAMNVYGEMRNKEQLLYSGDTVITVVSGEERTYKIILHYKGVAADSGAMTMVAALGKVGMVTFNGWLEGDTKRYYLSVTGEGNGMVNGSDSVMAGVPHTITAEPDQGYHFKVWQITNGNAQITDCTADSTSITLASGDATVKGIFDTIVTFRKTYGKSGYKGHSVQQTNDGGYIIGGSMLIKTDDMGNEVWSKAISGYSVQQTTDSGYIVSGVEYSQINLLKTTARGDTMWTRTYGGCGAWICSIQQTADGGYIIATFADVGGGDIYLIKTTANGDTLWTKMYSNGKGPFEEAVVFIQQTTDEGYIITGSELIRTDDKGNEIWRKEIGGHSARQTTDGGYIVTGASGDYSANLIKVASNGDILWKKILGENTVEVGESVQQTIDGGYILSARIWMMSDSSFEYLIKTTPDGDTTWTKMYEGIESNRNQRSSVQQTNDGGYIIVGSNEKGILLIKTDENGNVEE